MRTKQCVLCGRILTSANSNREHIIPNAIGGRKTVTRFICKICNSETGTDWDAKLAKQLQPLSLLLGIKRQQGSVKPLILPTSSGGKIRLHSDGKMTTAMPSNEETTDGNLTQLRVAAGSRKELRMQIRGMQRKHPPLKERSVDDLMSSAQESSYYSPDLIGITLEFGGENVGKSVVKSALALVYDAGIDPKVCDLALDYLTREDPNPCFGYFYETDRDLVFDRPGEKPFHCICVKGDSGSGTILGYVEFYGLHRMVLCLSESYTGRDFKNLYAIDPIKGEELFIDIDLNLSKSDVQSAFNYEKFDEEIRMSAVASLFAYIREIDFKREQDRVIIDAVEFAMRKSDAANGEYFTNEQLRQLTKEIVERMEPFLRHNAERFGYAPTTETSKRC